MRYKLALNANDLSQPPWRLIDEKGVSQYFRQVTFLCQPTTLAETEKGLAYRGWVVADGTLEIDALAQTAVIR